MKRYLTYVVTLIVITLSWIGLESIVDGQIVSQHSDGIVAIIFAYFMSDWIYVNYINK